MSFKILKFNGVYDKKNTGCIFLPSNEYWSSSFKNVIKVEPFVILFTWRISFSDFLNSTEEALKRLFKSYS